jgi:hypothetical protein
MPYSMACSGSFITSYFFWAALSGLFVGFALSRLMRFPARSEDRVRNWKWIMFSLYLSTGVILAFCAAFIPSSLCTAPRRLRVDPAFLDLRILYLAAGTAAAGFLSLRFKRAAGLPLLFIVVVGVAAIPAIKYPWRRINPDAPVAELRVLSIVDGKRSIEFTPDHGDTYFFELPSNGITVEVAVLRTSDYYFFVDRPVMYRLKSISPVGGDEAVFLSSDPSNGAGGGFQYWLQNLALRFPAWNVDSLSISTEKLLPLFRYAVFVEGGDGPSIKLIQPEE